MNRSNNHSHSYGESFTESRNPVKSSAHIMEEVMRTSRQASVDTALASEFSLTI